MVRIIKILIFYLLLTSAVKAETNVYFSPSLKCENSIIKLINEAQENIDVVVYAINNDNIVEALKSAYDKGVKIKILTDKTQASSKHSKVLELYQYGINIRVHSKHKIEHNKFAVFDSKKATSGSYNWTNPATSKNSENCIFFIKNKNIVEEYQNRFDYLWQINTKNKSDIWFQKHLNI